MACSTCSASREVERVLPEIGLVALRHLHVGRVVEQRVRGRSHKRDRAIELRQRVAERVHRAHPHIADRQPAQAVDGAFLAQHGVEIGEDLRGMLAPAVAAVDDRHARPLRGLVRRALLEVAHHDHVAVELQHLHRVLDGLLVPVARARHLGVGEAGDVPAQAVHRGLVRQARARRRLVERRHQRLLDEHIHIAALPRDRLQLGGNVEDVKELVPFKLFQRQNVTTHKTTHLKNLLFVNYE